MLNQGVQIICCCCCCCCSDLRHQLKYYWAPLSCLFSIARLCLVPIKVWKY